MSSAAFLVSVILVKTLWITETIGLVTSYSHLNLSATLLAWLDQHVPFRRINWISYLKLVKQEEALKVADNQAVVRSLDEQDFGQNVEQALDWNALANPVAGIHLDVDIQGAAHSISA